MSLVKIVFVGIVVLVIAGSLGLYFTALKAPQGDTQEERFIVGLNDSTQDTISKLEKEGFIRSSKVFRLLLGTKGAVTIQSGGYKISKSMNAWELAGVVSREPYMKWIVLPEGLRKEQIAKMLADELSWSKEEEIKWVTEYTALKFDEIEGVYFPDTYLIPVDEDPLKVADRLRAKFNERFAEYGAEAVSQNIRWPTVLKIASLVQREAASKDDMPIIAGILWNRLLEQNMRLDIDATVQYARDHAIHYGEAPDADQSKKYSSDGSWWTPIKVEDKKIDSPYNTYTHTGLPPHPIANPGLNAIRAVLYPEKTDCLYYLHDANRQIHCAASYKEHQENIETFLK